MTEPFFMVKQAPSSSFDSAGVVVGASICMIAVGAIALLRKNKGTQEDGFDRI